MSDLPDALRHAGMSLHDLMAWSNARYYAHAPVFGEAGDFVTAPEISQAFGEVLAACLLDYWQRRGAPTPLRLLELGPGRGTLMADMLRLLGKVAPALLNDLSVHLIETSPALRAQQETRLAAHGARVTWHATLDALPDDGFTLAVANEFFDALPVRAFARCDGAWQERWVQCARDDRLAWTLRPVAADDPLGASLPETAQDGAVHEIGPARQALMAALAARLKAHGGLALVLDYGERPAGPTGDTLQAVKAHQRVEPLAHPGESDWTTQVDFTALARSAQAAGSAVFGPEAQGRFLRALGLAERIERLRARADTTQRARMQAALVRLTSPAQMGLTFKVLGVADQATPAPAGLLPWAEG